MGFMRFSIILAVGIVLITAQFCFAGNNVLKIDSLQSYGNNRFSVQIHLDNSDTIWGFQAPLVLKFEGAVITIDSANFANGRCQDTTKVRSQLLADQPGVFYSGISATSGNEPLFLPGAGRIGLVFFMADTLLASQSLLIRQTTYNLGSNKLGYLFWGRSGEKLVCRFEAAPVRLRTVSEQ